MKFSRNPKTGTLEAYTDYGEFIGIIAMMGDVAGKPHNEEKPDEPEAFERFGERLCYATEKNADSSEK